MIIIQCLNYRILVDLEFLMNPKEEPSNLYSETPYPHKDKSASSKPQVPKKKLSIDIINLPRLRHKSTHHLHMDHSSTHPIKPYLGTQKPCVSSSGQSPHQNYLVRPPKHHKSLSKLELSLSQHRSHFQQLNNLTVIHLTSTFHKHKQSQSNLQTQKRLQKKKVYNMQKHEPSSNKVHRKSHVEDQNIKSHKPLPLSGLIDGKSLAQKWNKKNLKKSTTTLNQGNELYTGPMIVLDYKIEMSFINHFCFDGKFQLSRTGSTLNCKDNVLYLFGGFPDLAQNNLIFHKYSFDTNTWQHLNCHGEKPMLSLMYHTSNSFRQYIIFTGGISIEKSQLKHYSNPHIHFFHIPSLTFTQLNSGLYIKHHSSATFFSSLVIYGGINEREKTENYLHFVNINYSNVHFSKIFTIPTNEARSHHKLITTMNEDSRLRGKFKLDGLIVFGGKKLDESLSDDLMYIDAKQIKLNDDDCTAVRKWQKVPIQGPKPSSRMAHSFDLLTNKGLCVLLGGIGQNNLYLKDLWILDLFGLTWTLVQQVPLLFQTGGIAYHSTVVNESQIYIYGGITKNKTQKQFYLIETQKFKRQYSKHQSRKRIQLSSNMISFKAFQ